MFLAATGVAGAEAPPSGRIPVATLGPTTGPGCSTSPAPHVPRFAEAPGPGEGS
jgi:hypothetical protein